MGLIGMARRAGRAHGAYLAAQEDYHRNRQAMFDDMARQRFDMDRTAFAGNQEWLADVRAREKAKWGQADEDRQVRLERDKERFGWDRARAAREAAAGQRAQKVFEQGQEDRTNFHIPFYQTRNALAAAQLEAQNTQKMRNDERYGRMMRAYDQLSPEEQQSFDLGLMQMARRNAGKTGNTGNTGKAGMSDSQSENIAKGVNPDWIRIQFDKNYSRYGDDMFVRRTGKKRDQIFAEWAPEYAMMVRAQKDKVMPISQFIKMKSKQLGFASKYDLNKLMRYQAGDRVHGSKENSSHYEKKHPSLFKFQRRLQNEIIGAFGEGQGQAARNFMMNPDLMEMYDSFRNNGYNPKAAVNEVYRTLKER